MAEIPSQSKSDGPGRPQSQTLTTNDTEADSSWLDFETEVADGFAPRSRPHSRIMDSSRPNSFEAASGFRLGDSPDRGSMTKNRDIQGSSVMTGDRRSHSHERESAYGTTRALTSAGLSSNGTMGTKAQSQNPLQTESGPGPSDGTYSRSRSQRPDSMATISTVATPLAEGSLRPTHPYTLYPQNAFPETDNTPAASPQPIPVGFTGLNRQYERRRGPDGEEQDIVGPDGHAEQLPPYSRFPDSRPPNSNLSESRAAAAPSPNESEVITVPVAAPAGSMSQDTLALSPNVSGPHSSRSQMLPPASPAHSPMSEKRWREKNLREKGETRVCGRKVPLWMIALGFLTVLLFVIVIGGYFGARSKKDELDEEEPDEEEPDEEEPEAAETSTSIAGASATRTMFDASIIAKPSKFPNLVGGAYAVPNIRWESQQSGCLPLEFQKSAWSCDVSAPPVMINVISSQGPGYPGQSWVVNEDESAPFLYGMQTPHTFPQDLDIVIDLDDEDNGPAYYFQTTHDKLVILRENELMKPANERRDAAPAAEPEPPLPDDDVVVKAGDVAWFCYWNDTFVEGFIYVRQNASRDFEEIEAQATATAATAASVAQPVQLPVETESVAQLAPKTAKPISRRAMPQAFPYVLKLEERNLPSNEFRPFCQKMRMEADQSLTPIRDDDGEEVIILLGGQSFDFDEDKETSRRSRLGKRKEAANSCHCQWASR